MALLALGLAAPGSAQAAGPACGGHRAKTLHFATGEVRIHRGHTFACAVTVAKSPGKRRLMSVSVQARGSRPLSDTGHYTHHAGPVSVAAGSRCVFVRGAVDGRSVSSGWIMC